MRAVQVALGDHRDFDDLGPPLEQLRLGGAVVVGVLALYRTKGDVIGPRFARRQPVVARAAAEGADDGIGAQHLAGIAHRSGNGQVHTVQTQPFGQRYVVGDHQCDITRICHRAQRIGGA